MHVLGAFGIQPWGTLSKPGQPASAASGTGALAAESLEVLKGFKAELLYSVPKAEQGSWVSLTVDPRGRVIASDQYGPLYRITVPPIGGDPAETRVETLDVEIGAAHGLLYAFDSLYVVVNGKYGDKSSGLYRVRDTDGDDQFDEVTHLKSFAGAGEHGPHSVILTPDKKGLFVNGGNHTDLPSGLTANRVPMVFDEDHLLPRLWDARGHARGKYAPGGWVCVTDPAGESWQLFCNGYRNEYDIAVNRDGELFTFDADMEWDMGTPWYRPTRAHHVTSGAEFGWRSGTGKWPEYYPDSLPATLDIGPGSPTGITFGTGAKFPARYQDALYILDWTFGTMYAIHLEPKGASYTATKEEFVSGKPLPLTDAVIGPDGAMYFTVGGRRTQSGLYRVTYTGSESTAPSAGTKNEAAAELRKLRRRLERFHGMKDSTAIDEAWPHLGHRDRFIRFAARIAIEHQDVNLWQERALSEPDPRSRIRAIVALARHGSRELGARAAQALLDVALDRLGTEDRLALLRAYALTFIRMGRPDRALGEKIAARLEPAYPADDDRLNRELSRVLVYLGSPNVISKTLALMRKAAPERPGDIDGLLARNDGYGRTILAMFESRPARQKLHYALMLRNLRVGWTLAERREYFSWFQEGAKARGGASYGGFLNNIRAEAIANVSDAERKSLAGLLGPPPDGSGIPKELPTPKGPGHAWTLPELMPLVADGLRQRSFDRGRKAYAAAKCISCHRFAGAGGNAGPDLTMVVSRFSYRDLLESIFEPSKAISDQYESSVLVLKDGTVLVGRIVTDEAAKLSILVDPATPEKLTEVRKADVLRKSQAETSVMPQELLNALNRDEVLDLLAFIMSRGDQNDRVFK